MEDKQSNQENLEQRTDSSLKMTVVGMLASATLGTLITYEVMDSRCNARLNRQRSEITDHYFDTYFATVIKVIKNSEKFEKGVSGEEQKQRKAFTDGIYNTLSQNLGYKSGVMGHRVQRR